VITYRGTLDVPAETVCKLSGWLAAHRHIPGTRKGRRAASCYRQALMVARWFRDDTRMRMLAKDAGLGISTAYRYLHEGITVLAAQAPDLHDVLERARTEGWSHLNLDGTLIEIDRAATKTERGNDLWYSGKHKKQGGNVQVLCDPSGFPAWTSPAEPGSVHDITAAREHVLPALYPAAAAGLPTLTDKGYTGAGIGILVPVKGRNLAPDTACRNQLITSLRALGERGNALLKTRWTALLRIRLCPKRIGDIAAAALVLSTRERGTY
jgi:DDE superfamily endonuclease